MAGERLEKALKKAREKYAAAKDRRQKGHILQPPAERPALAGEKEKAQKTHLRTLQARHFDEAFGSGNGRGGTGYRAWQGRD